MNDKPRPDPLRGAVEDWRRSLGDVGGRNRLLFYRDHRNTLDLRRAQPNAVAALAGGQRVTITELYHDLDDELTKRARALYATTRRHDGERGINTLRLTLGLMTWRPPADRTGTTNTPSAPLIVVPAHIDAVDPVGNDFAVWAEVGDAHLNPALVDYLRRHFGTELATEVGIINLHDGLAAAWQHLRGLPSRLRDVPGAMLVERPILGNFAYVGAATRAELDPDHIASNPLISALAGDPEAVEDLAGAIPPASVGDGEHSGDEHLVLDADVSQRNVITRVLAGENLVVQGASGTGKTQTIANLVATLAGSGRSVLFVADKRRAVDDLMDRLDGVGLSGLVQDTARAGSRRDVAYSLLDGVYRASTVPQPDPGDLHDRLDAARQRLDAHVTVLHEPTGPWNLSPYEVQARLCSLAHAPCSDLDDDVAAAIDRIRFDELRSALREYVLRGGYHMGDPNAVPWATATLDDTASAEAAVALVNEAVAAVDEALRLLAVVLGETGLDDRPTLTGVEGCLALVETAARLEAVYDPGRLWQADLAALSDELVPARRWWSRVAAEVGNARYRRAKRQARSLAVAGSSPPPSQLADDLATACDLARRWDEAALLPVRPRGSQALAPAVAAFAAVAELVDALDAVFGPARPEDLHALAAWLRRLSLSAGDAHKVPRYRALRGLLEGAGLGSLLEACRRDGDDPQGAADRFARAWLVAIARAQHRQHRHLAEFDAREHDAAVEGFVHLDVEHLELNRSRVLRWCAERVVLAENRWADQRSVLEREAEKATGHLDTRQLFEAAGELILALKPCWAMSPLAVASTLPLVDRLFDVVIFDEASRVALPEAVPSLLRARQVVIVGDTFGLGPRRFVEDDPDVDDTPATVPSLLDAMAAVAPTAWLRHHYRDDRLIAFSNAWFYDSELASTPVRSSEPPVTLTVVPADPERPDDSGSSQAEVDAVAAAVVAHAKHHADQSLGVVAASTVHAERVADAVRARLAEDPDAAEFFAESRPEPFFVHDVVRAQGHVRDRVIVTVGSGWDAAGALAQHFGSFSGAEAQQALNVAVTRARFRLEVVTSFSPEDLDTRRLATPGVAALRDYLRFARSGGTDLGAGTPAPPLLDAFEADVVSRLERRGLRVVAAYGASSGRIEFAAGTDELVLAVETDGVAYAASPAVRDRDRLRRQVLERNGWVFRRIWSTAWSTDPDGEADALAEAWRHPTGPPPSMQTTLADVE